MFDNHPQVAGATLAVRAPQQCLLLLRRTSSAAPALLLLRRCHTRPVREDDRPSWPSDDRPPWRGEFPPWREDRPPWRGDGGSLLWSDERPPWRGDSLAWTAESPPWRGAGPPPCRLVPRMEVPPWSLRTFDSAPPRLSCRHDSTAIFAPSPSLTDPATCGVRRTFGWSHRGDSAAPRVGGGEGRRRSA